MQTAYWKSHLSTTTRHRFCPAIWTRRLRACFHIPFALTTLFHLHSIVGYVSTFEHVDPPGVSGKSLTVNRHRQSRDRRVCRYRDHFSDRAKRGVSESGTALASCVASRRRLGS